MVGGQVLEFTLLLLLLLQSDMSTFHIQAQSTAAAPASDLLPLLAPSPLMPFTNLTLPHLSGSGSGKTSKKLKNTMGALHLNGKCPLNFSSAESILATTAIDCWSSLAPYLANAVCCPQLDAAINILIARSSFSSGTLAIGLPHANDCLSDIQQILEAQGSNNDLLNLCSINPSELTQSSCPMARVSDIENTLNVSTILESCEKIDPVKECRHKVCETAIMDAAVKIALKNYTSMPVRVAMIDDCRKIVLRWLMSRLDPVDGNKVLRGISSCKINKVCPLVFPDLKHVTKECGDKFSNDIACCDAMEKYISRLQVQTFVTNLQAFNCASLLTANLQKANISRNVYNICGVKLKDLSIQVGSQDSGCLFPSLPFDVTYDQSSGIEFKCDLNDNVPAPWPSYAYSPVPSSTIGTDLPALPKAASDQSGLQSTLFISILLVLNLFI